MKRILLLVAAVLLCARGSLLADQVQIRSQSLFLFAQTTLIDSSSNTPVDQQEAELRDMTIGPHQASTNVTATQLGGTQNVISSNSFSMADVTGSTVMTGVGHIEMEMAGVEFWPVYMGMRGLSQVRLTAQIELTNPCLIAFAMNADEVQTLSYDSNFVLKKSGVSIFSVVQRSSLPASAPQYSGRLEPGIYDVSFELVSNSFGTIGPDISNLLDGQCSVNWSLSFEPAELLENTPELYIELDRPNDRIKLNMTELKAGRSYIIRRSEDVVAEIWPIVGGFTAASDTAIWMESIDPSAVAVFYRLGLN